MKAARFVLAVVCAMLTLGMLIEALTAPAVAATAPAVLSIAFGAATYLLMKSSQQA